jgi:DNA-binding LytR/AlgR family response regulator
MDHGIKKSNHSSIVLHSVPLVKRTRRAKGEDTLTRRVLIKSDRKIHFVREQEINFVEAAGNYVHVSLGGDTLFTRSSLNRLEALLSAERFVRIHRSAIVNMDRICHVEPQAGGEYLLTLDGGKQLKASRRHVCQLLKSLRGHVQQNNLVAAD